MSAWLRRSHGRVLGSHTIEALGSGAGSPRCLLTSSLGYYTLLGSAPLTRSIAGWAWGHLALPRPSRLFTASLHRHHWRATTPWGFVSKVHLVAMFLFSRSEIGFASPSCFIVATSLTLLTTRAPVLVVRPSPPVQALVLPMLLIRFVILALGPSPRLLPPPRRQCRRCC